MSALLRLPALKPPPAPSPESDCACHCLAVLGRLQSEWRPGAAALKGASHLERWSIDRCDEATVYQFIGYAAPQSAEASCFVIGTVLAIDPAAGWAFLASGRWVTLGNPAPDLRPFDPQDVTRRADAWLRSEAS